MEKDFESWFHQQQLHLPPPNPNLLGCPFDIDGLNNEPICRSPYFVGDTTLRTVPLCPVPQLKPLKANEPNLSGNWFNDTRHSYKAFTPELTKEKFLTGHTAGIAPEQKRFLVFDHSNEKTTLIYSSGVQTAVQRGINWNPIPLTGFNLNKEPPPDSGVYHFMPIKKDECGKDKLRDDLKDEMREDTEELNALLYSDNDSYFLEDDEETGTGHSPSTMTDNGVKDSDEETGEEVDSSFGPCKRHKFLNGGFDVASNIRTTKTSVFSALKDDAESSNGNCNKQSVENIGSLSGGKRSRREKIRETVSVLQNIIPSVKSSKDAIVVIDEAINYLKSLKVKAMALGLDTL